MRKAKKRYIFLTFILSITNIIAYANKTKIIDSLLLRTQYLNQMEGNVAGVIETSFEAIRLSEKIGYERGAEIGLYTIAVLLSDNGDFKRSIEYIEKAKKFKNFLKENQDSEFNLLILQAYNNYELGFSSLARSFYQKAEGATFKIKDNIAQKYYLSILYMQSYLAYKDEDSAYAYLQRAKILLDKLEHATLPARLPRNEIQIKTAELNTKLGDIHLSREQTDSARLYYTNALNIGRTLQNEFIAALAMASLAKADEQEGKYENAIKNIEPFEALSAKRSIYGNLQPIYIIKRRIYGKMGNITLERKYDSLHRQLSDDLEHKKSEGRDKSVLELINEKETALEEERSNKKHIVLFISLGTFLMFLSGLLWFRKYRKNKVRLLIEQKQLLELKGLRIKESEVKSLEMQQRIEEFDTELKQVENENKQLLHKINASFDEIITLAKNNDPHFWKRFQEIYPLFLPKMLTIDPNFRASELMLCAYVYLGFTSKEYATYTFKSSKTVESYRYSARKRLKLDSNIDLKLWIQRYIDGQAM